MNWFTRLFFRRRRYAELSESIHEHLAEKIDELMEGGMSRQEAERTARREFGNVTLIEERSREIWQWTALESIWADVRFALRQIRKSPGFVITICLTLALGIGANLTVFLILYGVLLRPLPFPQPQQLVRINRFYPVLHDAMIPAYSGTKALFLRRTSQTLESTAAYDYIPSHTNLTQGDQVIPLETVRATSDFFHVFQMEPEIGRGFLSGDMVPNAPGVAVISDSVWHQQFDADPNIIGRSINLGTRNFTVVGVANPHFHLNARVDVWTPLAIEESPEDQSNMYNFKALRIPVLAGRSFGTLDSSGTQPVIVINEQFARTYFKGQNPMGQRIRIGAVMGAGFEDKVREIIGIVGDTKNSGLDAPAPGIMYLPQVQIPDSETKMEIGLLGISWVVRTQPSQVDVTTPARHIFMNNARTPLLDVGSMSDVISDSVAQQRFTMMLLGCFGLISLLMGAAGLYGVMSYTLARRTGEIGVRMAVGADRESILFMVLREAGLLVGLGLTLGLAVSLAAAQLLRGLLFGVSARDPLTLAATCGVLLLTGLFAAWQPASHAASTEPMQALRAE